MTREKKTAPGWRRTMIGDISAGPYSGAALQKLVALLPLRENADINLLHRELQVWACMYLHAKQNVDHAPKPSEIREELNKLRKQAGRLRDTLSALDDESRGYLDRAGVGDATENRPDPVETSSTALALGQIEGLIGMVDHSLETIRKGGPQNVARPLFVHGLANLWLQFTGNRPTRIYSAHPADDNNGYTQATKGETGPFKTFVTAAIETLDPEDIKHGLDDNIREAVEVIRPMG